MARVSRKNQSRQGGCGLYKLVVEECPLALAPHLAGFENIKPKGSTGDGNITAAPWIALFDLRLTDSATRGYYIVYLFSIDLSAVTLSLAFGTTQFAEQFGASAYGFKRMRFAATRLQEMFNHLFPPDLSRGPVDLAAKRSQRLHYAYQQAAILSFSPYRLGALPAEEQLVSDLQLMIRLYDSIVSDPLEVTVERLVEAVVEPAPNVETIEIRDFIPRPSKRKGNGGDGGGKQKRRYSPESRKVGDAGERTVLDQEKAHLFAIGRPELAARIRWHSQEQDFPGWDVTSFDDSGNEIFIEVKSTVGKSISSVCLTVNEWEAACDPRRRDRYCIYIVTRALSAKPRIEKMVNPAGYLDRKEVTCEPIVYEMTLGPDEEP